VNSVVTILQHRLLHYRVDFFQHLHDILKSKGIDLHLVHGQASPTEKVRKDEGVLNWAEPVENKFLRISNVDLVWQPLQRNLQNSDLIIIMQENRLLSNYPILLRGILGNTKVAYWGHGANFQTKVPSGVREYLKRTLSTKVDWWFAYTSATVGILRQNGFPDERITCLNNAIDTHKFHKDVSDCSIETLEKLRKELTLEPNAIIGLHCGSLYPDKRLDLMITAADIVHAQIPNFNLVVIGDGPSASILQDACITRPWCHWVGVKTGVEKAAYYRLARVNINPGLVGLHILDAFAAGLPMVSTHTARHSPEIAYLDDGINGILTGDTAQEYAQAIIHLLEDSEFWEKMSNASRESAKQYTVENMALNFAEGITKCLKQSKKNKD